MLRNVPLAIIVLALVVGTGWTTYATYTRVEFKPNEVRVALVYLMGGVLLSVILVNFILEGHDASRHRRKAYVPLRDLERTMGNELHDATIRFFKVAGPAETEDVLRAAWDEGKPLIDTFDEHRATLNIRPGGLAPLIKDLNELQDAAERHFDRALHFLEPDDAEPLSELILKSRNRIKRLASLDARPVRNLHTFSRFVLKAISEVDASATEVAAS